MAFELRALLIEDYDQVRALWEASEGVGLSAADERGAIAAFLARNPGLSLVATEDGEITGALLLGHDGRRGYMHHLAVAPGARRRGLGAELVKAGLRRLSELGIGKCHVFVFHDNETGRRFWTRVGAARRTELEVYSLAP